jgi:NADH:ubiquinone oxidoreductase subunit F (NADH-binding)
MRILDEIATGNGTLEMLDLLFELGDTMRIASDCPVGKTALVPVLFTLEHFRDTYEEHILDKRCPFGICQKVVQYHTICPLKSGVPV